MKDFQELIVWQKAIMLVTRIYVLTKNFPSEERFGIVSQIRRAAVSIPSNIAEGHMRRTTNDFRQFLFIARGSCAEVQTQLIIAHKLGYMADEEFHSVYSEATEIAKMLSSFSAKL